MSSRQKGSVSRSSSSGLPGYTSSTSKDPRSRDYTGGRSGGAAYGSRSGGGSSSRYERGSGSGSSYGHSTRGERGYDEQPGGQWQHETVERQQKHVSFFGKTTDQLYHTPPCTGVLYIIATLIMFWFIGIAVGAAKFSASTRDVGKVENLHDLQDAMVLIGQDKRAQGYFLMLVMFIGAMCLMWVYLAVVVLYNAIVNNKGIISWMKEAEIKNNAARKVFKKGKQRQGDRMIIRHADDTR